MIFVGAVEVPHSAKTPGRETFRIRVVLVQVLRCHHCGTLFRSPAHDFANFAVQLYLGQLPGHQLIKSFVHFGVIDVLSDVHGTLLSNYWMPFL